MGETSFEKGTNGEIRGGRRDGGLSEDRIVVVEGVVEVVVPSVEVEDVKAAKKRRRKCGDRYNWNPFSQF